jgi:cytidine deaminase
MQTDKNQQSLTKDTVNKILNLAAEASKNAYAPYSKFNVGACLLYDDGSTFVGCNVENASYGITLCAERNAISNAVVNGKTKGLVAVAIHSPNTKFCYPCGACRQWIAEFSSDAVVIVEDSDGSPKFLPINELLPYSFYLEP